MKGRKMKRCPISYEPINPNEKYSKTGLSLLSRNLVGLKPFPYTVGEQLQLASVLASKISIQGVQPKLSVKLDVKNGVFVVVERGGRFIIKPQNPMFPNLPENEDLTMKLASSAGIEIPVHGLAWGKDDRLLYFIKRFDRMSNGQKIALEDFAQLAGLSRDTKYSYSVERIVGLIDSYMTFPVLEKVKLFRLVLFNFLAGNEDAHLKNYSIIVRDGKRELSPGYDLVNSTLALGEGASEESALPLAGKKKNLTKNDFFRYLGRERLELTGKIIASITEKLEQSIPEWESLIHAAFLPAKQQEAYWEIVTTRARRLFG
jgi:serine/threonine-protein kinase HipA